MKYLTEIAIIKFSTDFYLKIYGKHPTINLSLLDSDKDFIIS